MLAPMPMHSSKVTIAIGEESVSGLLLRPADAKALYVFVHGAGAGMTHRAMGSTRKGSRRADRDLALPVSLHGEGRRRPTAQDRPRSGASRGGGGGEACA